MNNWKEIEKNKCYEFEIKDMIVRLETPLKTGSCWRVSRIEAGQCKFTNNFMQETGLEDAKEMAIKMALNSAFGYQKEE